MISFGGFIRDWACHFGALEVNILAPCVMFITVVIIYQLRDKDGGGYDWL